MAIGPFMDVSTLSVDRLYDLYLSVAQCDQLMRIQAIYGSKPPPAGHSEFRPLSRETFTQRVLHYDSLEDGRVGESLRQRLARQAFAYGVDDFEEPAVRRAA